jgi:hypothetical protein
MSSQYDLHEMDELDAELAELMATPDAPPEAFYLALKQALNQLEHHSADVQREVLDADILGADTLGADALGADTLGGDTLGTGVQAA